ncbi:hypothetical protein Q8A73_017172 [Channa argus]|nr:hypothetical protein Q8A73_017172 [Channa argus]
MWNVALRPDQREPALRPSLPTPRSPCNWAHASCWHLSGRGAWREVFVFIVESPDTSSSPVRQKTGLASEGAHGEPQFPTLIDSGSDGDFMSSEIVLRLGTPTINIDSPLVVNTINGSLIHRITACTSSPAPPDLSTVPAEYHDLGAVFSKAKAQSLPPHPPYDCAIELLPGAQPPKGHLYPLTKPEREAMELYLGEGLEAVIIRPSSSPAGAGFSLFCFSLSYRPGSKNINPDALSRQHQRGEDTGTSPVPSIALSRQHQRGEDTGEVSTILPPSVIVGVTCWALECKVKASLNTATIVPSGCLCGGLPNLCPCKDATETRRRFPTYSASIFLAMVSRCHGLYHWAPSFSRGPQFVASFWREFCRLLGVSVSLSSGFHPQTNSQMERYNQDHETALQALCSMNPGSWSSQLPWAEYAHNSLVTSSGYSPFQAAYGYQPPLFPHQEVRAASSEPTAFVRCCQRTWRRFRTLLLKRYRRRTPAPE